MPEQHLSHKHSGTLFIAAFAGLYIIWGSTYLGILIAIETIPPFMLVASRFILAGGILLVWRLAKGESLPSRRSVGIIAASGILMLFVGNGAVTWSEQYVPSGLAAIVVATVPLWFILLDKRQWAFHFSNKLIVIGVLIGFGGVILLFSGKDVAFSADRMKLASFGVLIIGTISWATGSLVSKYKKVDGSTTMRAALQMLAAGILALCFAFLRKEHHGFSIADVSMRSMLALLYLILFGSIVAYISYIWLLSVKPPSIVGTYAYVNPVVAVLLGWFVVGEAISAGQALALAVILTGVILISFPKAKGA